MKCRMRSKNGLEVTLSREEMTALDITYEKLDYANTETRRMLWTVLDEAGSVLGCSFDLSGKIRIEARPDGEGGCILDFTLQADPTVPVQKPKKPRTAVLFETDSADDLLAAVQHLSESINADLYMLDGTFRLLWHTDTRTLPRLSAVLTEFGTVQENCTVAAAQTAEYWSLVCKNAVGLLHSYRLLRENTDVQT